MIHQLVCEGQTGGMAVAVVSLRTVGHERSGAVGDLPVYTSTVAYYVVPRRLASSLT